MEVIKAKTICECLIASEGVDLKFEEAFCSLLLGQVSYFVTFCIDLSLNTWKDKSRCAGK